MPLRVLPWRWQRLDWAVDLQVHRLGDLPAQLQSTKRNDSFGACPGFGGPGAVSADGSNLVCGIASAGRCPGSHYAVATGSIGPVRLVTALRTRMVSLTHGWTSCREALDAYGRFLGFCLRFSRDTQRRDRVFEIAFLEISSLIVPIYTAFMLLVLGERLDALASAGGGLFALGRPVVIATAAVLAYLLMRTWLQPRISGALVADEVQVKRGLLADYARVGRLAQVDPETFDDEMDQIGRLGRFFGQDSVEVSAQVITFLVVIPLETLLTGPIVLVSLLMAAVTTLLVLTTSDAFKRSQWQVGQRVIEVQAERRIWRRCIRSLIGLFPSSRLLKRMFRAMDAELSAFCERDREVALFDQKLELMANLERVLSLGLAASGVVLGVFDTSQFLLILFVSGRLINPLRRTLRVWLATSRTVQGLQLFERVLKRSASARAALREPVAADRATSSAPAQAPASRLWLADVPVAVDLQTLLQIRPRALVVSAEAPTLNGSLLENLTLGNARLEDQALRFLSWSGLQPWISALPNGHRTQLEEDQPALPLYIAQILGALRLFLFVQAGQLVIDNRLQQLEPEAIAAIINVLNRWPEAPALVVLGASDLWPRLRGLQRAQAVTA